LGEEGVPPDVGDQERSNAALTEAEVPETPFQSGRQVVIHFNSMGSFQISD
jgi:hypothetical protein